MIKVTTKAGDHGQTGLANGERLPKHHPVFAAIGSLDELNSWLGLVVALLGNQHLAHRRFLLFIQEQLFVMGGELARSPGCLVKPSLLTKIEQQADQLQSLMADGWHRQFLLPGGTSLAAYLDITRTVCRRCERDLVSYQQTNKFSPLLLKCLNRLSDYLYILRCFVNWSAEVTEKKFDAKKAGGEK